MSVSFFVSLNFHCYKLSDVDECNDVNSCAANYECTNTVGSYTCTCPSNQCDGMTKFSKIIYCMHFVGRLKVGLSNLSHLLLMLSELFRDRIINE